MPAATHSASSTARRGLVKIGDSDIRGNGAGKRGRMVTGTSAWYALSFPVCERHPERSRFSGGVKDLPRTKQLQGRSLAPLVKAWGFGMTHSMDFCRKSLNA